MATQRVRALILAAFMALATLAPAAPAGAATTTKTYTPSVTPAALTAGQPATLTVKIVNNADPQALGSVNVIVPPPLALVADSVSGPLVFTNALSPGVPTGSAKVVSGAIQLRNLSVPPGGWVQLTLGVDVPCSGSPATWADGTNIRVKQSNDFNGPPGNDFVPSPAATTQKTTWTDGGCKLVFTAPGPANANVNMAISGEPFVPAAATEPPAQVTVEVRNASDQLVTSFTGAVTIGLNGIPASTSPLTGGGPVTVTGGIAKFPSLKVATVGTYRLRATSPGLTDALSGEFTVFTANAVCAAGQPCSVTATLPVRAASSYTATAPAAGDTGFLTLRFDPAIRIDCADYVELTDKADTVTVDLTAKSRSKTVALEIGKVARQDLPNNGVAGLQFCYGHPSIAFTTRSGLPATRQDTNGDGIVDQRDWFVGLLPDCGTAPCVSDRAGLSGARVRISALLPPGDPAFRG